MAKSQIVGLLLLLLALAFATEQANSTKKEIIEAWFIPHSHDDVGWLKTIDEYYEQEVRHIYNTVVEELDKREDRKFIIVEMAFFTMWWNEATQAQKDLVFKYVAAKKVEFVLGGWCMNDDADPTYSASVNQMAEGHRFIFDTFGVMPKYGWHIDPFGLSSYYPTLFAKMGFSGHVINRIHYNQKDQWKASKELEFVWRGSKSLGSETEMFTHVLDSHYSFPGGFNFERDPPITDSDIAYRSDSLVTELKKRAGWYRSKHLLVPGGDDFRYQNAKVQFENWDKLIDYINARSEEYGLRIRYATLGEYFEAVNKEQISWPIYTEDFFPYADNQDSYWTGYFTTHSQLKGYIRSSAALLRATELYGLATNFVSTPSGNSGDPTQAQQLRWATAEAQHHDGVTGTSKIKVIDMYYEHLDDASYEASELLLESIGYLADKTQGPPEFEELPFPLEDLKPGQFAPIVVANTLSWKAHTVHGFVTTRSDLAIFDGSGQRVRSQIVPYPFSDDGITRYHVFFEINVAPAGFLTYYAAISEDVEVTKAQTLPMGHLIENGILSINVTEAQGALIFEVTNKRDGQAVHITEEIMEYTSYTGSGQKSGAYIFRPTGSAKRVSSSSLSVDFYDGDLVKVIHQQADATHSQVVRLYNVPGETIEDVLEVQFGIGPLKQDAECIVRFTTSIVNSTLYSDNNGIEMHKRPAATGLIQQNYYPMVAQAFLSDEKRQFGMITERTVGVASLQPGQIETMIHRRCSQDDGRGMGEALDDDTTVYPTFRLFFGSHLSLEKNRPNQSVRLQHRPRNFYAPPTSSISSWSSAHRTELTTLKAELPPNLHLLAFKTVVSSGWERATVRLHNIYEKDSHPEMAVPVEVDLKGIFLADYDVSDELELSGITPMAEASRLAFSVDNPRAKRFWMQVQKEFEQDEAETQVVVVDPMQIKTFEFTFTSPNQ